MEFGKLCNSKENNFVIYYSIRKVIIMINMPQVKLGIVAVSRDCFPMSLSEGRRSAIVKEYAKYGEIYECPVCIENENGIFTVTVVLFF